MDNNFRNQFPDFQAISKSIEEKKKHDNGFASILAKQIYKQTISFDQSINPDEEVGIKLVQYGEIIKFTISNIGYKDPYLIYFYGLLDDGSPIQLIQHVNQISFVLIKMKRLEPDSPKRQIGFCSE